MRNIAAPNHDTRPVDRALTSEDFAEIRVVHSTVGRMVSRQIDVKIDANDLIDHLKGQVETRGTETKYDLLKIERWCRDHLERNTPVLKDAKNIKATLINEACDWQGEAEPNPAGPDQVRPIVTALLQEYSTEE